MALHLRKLMTESVTESVSELCDHYCDDSNESFLCPSSCLSFCPEFCKIPESSSYDDYDPPDPPPHKTAFSLIWVVFTAAIAATVLVVAAYAFYLRSKRRRQRGRPHEQHQDPEETLDREFLDQDRGPVVEHHIWYINTVGLQQAVIDSITVCKYKNGEGLVEGTECSVCLSEFQEDETLRLLPKCSHAFHIPCIDTWLRSHTNCPMCRAPIVAPPQGVDNPIGIEEIENSGSGREFAEQGSETEEEEGELEAENREKDETQQIRRSFSLDSSSASKITVALANALPEDSDGDSNSQLVKSSIGSSTSRGVENQSLLRLVSSTQRSFQRGSSSSIMRSLSCSGKLFLSRNSRSRNLTLPL